MVAHDAKSSGCKGATTRTFSPAETVWTPCHTTRSPGAMPLETVTVRSPYRDTSTRRNSSDPSAFTIQTAGSLPAWKSAVEGSVNAWLDVPDVADAGVCANAT